MKLRHERQADRNTERTRMLSQLQAEQNKLQKRL